MKIKYQIQKLSLLEYTNFVGTTTITFTSEDELIRFFKGSPVLFWPGNNEWKDSSYFKKIWANGGAHPEFTVQISSKDNKLYWEGFCTKQYYKRSGITNFKKPENFI